MFNIAMRVYSTVRSWMAACIYLEDLWHTRNIFLSTHSIRLAFLDAFICLKKRPDTTLMGKKISAYCTSINGKVCEV